MNSLAVLIIDRDTRHLEWLSTTLTTEGYQVRVANEGGAALEILEQESIGMVLSDVQIGALDGFQLLRRIKKLFPELPVMLMSACAKVESAVKAIRDGAVDYLAKPVDLTRLMEQVANYLRPLPQNQINSPVVVDLRSREVLELARRVAASEATVMLNGESGTGKEVFAQYIHQASPRREGPFIAINCAAIPENMLEAMLFGYEKGAFTGAYQATPGKFEQAQGGTLLLDEISEMCLPLQAKLLRVLQEKELERLGGRKLIDLDVRVLATTNRNLREEVAAHRFREDLYYRLNVFPLTLPPLRERQRDILPLANHLLKKHLRPGQPHPMISAEAGQKLLSHPWPGNVRELDNLMQRAMILHDGAEIEADSLCFEDSEGILSIEEKPVTLGSLPEDLRSVEERMILEALDGGRNSRRNVAAQLGISERTLRYKIARMRDAGVAIPGR
jgi:two-component system response regulator FlrC